MAYASTASHSTARTSRVLSFASPTQREFFEYGPAPACASGGWGAGKTAGACLKALLLSDLYPGNRGFIARRVWDDLRKTTMATFFKLCPPEAYSRGKRSDAEKLTRLNNGSEILWGHMDDPETENLIKGLEINWFVLDQAEEIQEEIFDLLLGRLGRWDGATVPQHLIDSEKAKGRAWPWLNPGDGRPMPPPYALITCNPSEEIHWIYRRFHPDSPEYRERTIDDGTGKMVSHEDMGYRLFNMPSASNKFLSKHNLSQMLRADPSFVRRFVKGEWGIPEGQIHEVTPESLIPGDPDFVAKLLRTCRLHRTLDHGDVAPTACIWWAVDAAGNSFAFREYYMPNKLISDHRLNIARMSEGERYDQNLADPSIFNAMQRRHGKWAVSDEYAECKNLPRETAIFWQPADNNEMGTRNRISEYLRLDPERLHPYTGKKGAPRLYFVQRSMQHPQGVFHLLRETKAQRRKRLGAVGGKSMFCDDRDDKMSDHAYDCLRYHIAARPAMAVGVEDRLNPHSFNAVRRRLLEFKEAGGFSMLAHKARVTSDSFR